MKRYRVMRKLEKRKYHGGYFTQDIRTLTSYFAGKHLLGPDIIDENISAYSGEVSRMSETPRMGNNVPPHRPKVEDFSPSPARSHSNQRQQHLSVHASSAGRDKLNENREKLRNRTTAKIQPFTNQH